MSSTPNDERVAELAMLQQYLEEALTALEQVTQTMAAPADRLRKLLTAQDKAATLYEMAGVCRMLVVLGGWWWLGASSTGDVVCMGRIVLGWHAQPL